MTPGIAAPLLTISLLSVSQLLPCGKSPTEDYKRFAEHAEKGKCKSVYNDLSSDSKSRLDAYLSVMRDLAIAAYDQENPPEPVAPTASTADAGVEAPAADAGVGSEEEGEEQPPPPPPPLPFADLRELSGKALFVSLCQGKPADLPTLYREQGLGNFVAIKPKIENKEGDKARLLEKKPSKKKGKKKGKKAEADTAEDTGVELVKEGGRYRVVLEPMGIEWFQADGGRLLPKFSSPVLTIGVDSDGKRTPSYAYERIVEHLHLGRCEEFYAGLDSASRARIELTVPMMIGFASVISTNRPEAGASDNRGQALVVALCKKASPAELKATGLHLGEVLKERLTGNQAVLTIRTNDDEAGPTHDVMMVREQGQWHLSIDAFSELADEGDPEADGEADDDEENDDEENDDET